MKKHFLDLLHYDVWANRRLLITITENGITSDRILSIMSHVLSAQLIWLNRIVGLGTAPFPVWEKYNLVELESMTEESNERWLKFISEYKLETFDEIIRYQNTGGTNFENSLQDIITHVLNHSAHHRGQLAMLLRDEGIDPPANDFIIFKRL